MSSIKYKIAVFGAKDAVLGFKSVGADVFFSDGNKDKLDDLIYDLSKKKVFDEKSKEYINTYAVIFVTESVAVSIESTIKDISGGSYFSPAVIIIPDSSSRNKKTSFALTRLKQIAEKAIGADVL